MPSRQGAALANKRYISASAIYLQGTRDQLLHRPTKGIFQHQLYSCKEELNIYSTCAIQLTRRKS